MSTHYPKSGKRRKWTVAELKAIPQSLVGDTLSDGEGLSGEVRIAKDGAMSVRWKYAFSWEGKVKWFHAGTWPKDDLDAIRRRRDAARDLKAQGVNPNTQKAADRVTLQRQAESVIEDDKARKASQLTVSDMFDAWIEDGVKRADGNASIRSRFDNYVTPVVGSLPVSSVTDGDLKGALKAAVDRGVDRTAVLLSQELKQMFTWAEKRQPWRRLLADGNPADLLEIKKVVSDDYDIENIRERVLSADELRELGERFALLTQQYEEAPAGTKYDFPRPVKETSQLAIWICLSTLSRIGETLMAEWTHVDFKNRTWYIPKENVKGERGRKQEHLIYLSDFALRQFLKLKKLTGKQRWLFPAKALTSKNHVDLKSVTKQMTDRQEQFTERAEPIKGRRQDNSLVLSRGKNGKWTPHDMRRTGATMMQALKVPPDVIDRCQNHVLGGSKVRRAYQHHEYKEEMKVAWDALGTELERIFSIPSNQHHSSSSST